MKESKDFYNILFDKDEHTCFSRDTYGNTSYEVSEGLFDKSQFFTINPLIKGRTRAGSNVKRYRNLLFEQDNGTIQEQGELIFKSQLPYSTLVHSGGKSIHAIVSLAFDIDRIQYDAMWLAIDAALKKSGMIADKACKDPARFSRSPNAIRDNGNKQKLAKTTSRKTLHEIESWLQDNGIDWNDYLPKQEYNTTENTVSSADDQIKIDWIDKYYMNKDEYTEGGRHNYQIKYAYCLLRTGMSPDSIDSHFKTKFGEISDGIKTTSTLKCDDKPIYVPTMEERKAYYKTLEDDQRAIDTKQKYQGATIENAVVDVLDEDIERYIRVGVKYFKTNALGTGLIDWDKGTFQDDYGRGTLPSRLYDGFQYKPDYISDEFPADLFNGKFRNRFTRPDYEIKEGEWNTIKAALQHAFQDQYELILKMCAVMLKWPETRLPILVLLGEEGVGKSAIIKIFQILLGNSKSIKSKQFESDFDGFLMDTQLLVIEEAGAWKDPGAVADEFKRLCTEVGEIEINPKYGKQSSYSWYGWLMCTSNDLSPVKMEGAATRFWVRELTKIPNPVEDFYGKVRSEMGAFAHHLLNEVYVEDPETRTARLYFDPEEYWTKEKDFAKDLIKSPMHNDIFELIDTFFAENADHDTLYFDLKVLKMRTGDKYSDKDLKICLKREFGITDKTKNLTRPNGLIGRVPNDINKEEFPLKKTQWYIAKRSDFIDPLEEQMDAILNA
jgi:hypothetical protein